MKNSSVIFHTARMKISTFDIGIAGARISVQTMYKFSWAKPETRRICSSAVSLRKASVAFATNKSTRSLFDSDANFATVDAIIYLFTKQKQPSCSAAVFSRSRQTLHADKFICHYCVVFAFQNPLACQIYRHWCACSRNVTNLLCHNKFGRDNFRWVTNKINRAINTTVLLLARSQRCLSWFAAARGEYHYFPRAAFGTKAAAAELFAPIFAQHVCLCLPSTRWRAPAPMYKFSTIAHNILGHWHRQSALYMQPSTSFWTIVCVSQFEIR